MSSQVGSARCGWIDSLDTSRKGYSHSLGGQDKREPSPEMRKGPWWAAGTRIQTAAFEELVGDICLVQLLLHPALGHCFQEGMSQALGKRRQICTVSKGCPTTTQSMGRKGKMSISREEPPNLTTHLLRHFCHHGNQLAITHPIRACFTQTSVEPGVPKTDKYRALGTGFILPPFSHTPSGEEQHTSLPDCTLWHVTQLRKPARDQL